MLPAVKHTVKLSAGVSNVVGRGATGVPSWVWLCGLVCACLAPFANKSFHIDDTLFLRAAEQIQHHPLDFYGFKMNWYGATRPMVENFDNPPLACYYIALVTAIVGWGEPGLHLGFLLPALAAAWGIFLLARRHSTQPLLAAAVAVLTPVFLISATTLMCDVLLLAFWVWAIVFFEEGLAEHRCAPFFASGVLAGLAFLTKFTGLALLPLLTAYGLISQRRGSWWIATPILLLFFAGCYEWMTHQLYGKGLLLTAVGVSSHAAGARGSSFLDRQILGIGYVGGCFLPLLFYTPWLWSARGFLKLLLLTAPCLLVYPHLAQCALLLWHADGSPNWLLCIQSAAFITGGVHLFLLAGSELWERRDATALLLILWILGIFAFATTFNWTLNGRSVLPMVPAIGILVARRVERQRQTDRAVGLRSLVWPAILAATICLLLAKADYDLAGTGRKAARELCAKFQDSRKQLWFEGHWGFQYYMEQGGAKALESDFALPRPGDTVIVPSEGVNVIDLATNLVRLVDTLEYAPNTHYSTMSLSAGAGFYAGTAGAFPFSIGHIDPERYYVFEVVEKLAGPSPAPKGLFESGAVMHEFDLARQARASEDALRANPSNVAAHLQLGRFYSSHSNNQQAIKHFLAVLAKEPDNEMAHRELGVLLARQPDHQ
jgi:4-amino-4-deoxy-L-arabinose transferase-like glycosyltransferase